MSRLLSWRRSASWPRSSAASLVLRLLRLQRPGLVAAVLRESGVSPRGWRTRGDEGALDEWSSRYVSVMSGSEKARWTVSGRGRGLNDIPGGERDEREDQSRATTRPSSPSRSLSLLPRSSPRAGPQRRSYTLAAPAQLCTPPPHRQFALLRLDTAPPTHLGSSPGRPRSATLAALSRIAHLDTVAALHRHGGTATLERRRSAPRRFDDLAAVSFLLPLREVSPAQGSLLLYGPSRAIRSAARAAPCRSRLSCRPSSSSSARSSLSFSCSFPRLPAALAR